MSIDLPPRPTPADPAARPTAGWADRGVALLRSWARHLEALDQRQALLGAVALAMLAIAIRAIGVGRSYELWVDEMLYAQLGHSVARGEMPNLPDGPFLLHPPGFFLVEGGTIRLFGLGLYDAVDLAYAMRWVNVVGGVVTVLLVYALCRAVGATAAALPAGVVTAVEPFLLRTNSRAFLETTAWAAALAGILVLVVTLGSGMTGRRRVVSLVAAGLLVGWGVLSKDVLLALVGGPLLLAVVWRGTLRAREAATVLAAAITPYGVYLLVLGLGGHLRDWTAAKTGGLVRMAGAEQSTGFNAPGSPSLVERLLDQLLHFGSSYVLLLACPLVGVVACLSADARRRFVGLVAVCAGGFGLYAAAFGTLEEQYGYAVVLVAIPAAAVAAIEVVARFPWLGRAVALTAGAFVLAAVALGVSAQLTVDDGFRGAENWASAHLPRTAKIGLTNTTGAWAFGDEPRYGRWSSPRSLLDNGAQYVLTQDLPTRQGYGTARPEFLDWLATHAVPVFRSDGPSNGSTVLWFVGESALRQGAEAGVGLPERVEDR